MASNAPILSLLALCDELLLLIFSSLDIPELLSASRVCYRLRSIALDPILHAHRLQYASILLAYSLPQRPPLSSLLPPISTIYLSSTRFRARTLSRCFISIKLNRSLSRRPSASSLISSNILPEECCRQDSRTGQIVWGGGVAPGIIGMKRKIEKERLKDGLRAWIARRADAVEKRLHSGQEREKPSVRNLVQRFARRAGGKEREGRWGRGVLEKRKRSSDPTRTHVLGLKRFWEGVGRSGSVMT
ncbi:MAG: hypothetical protein M1812_003943 [Candelaria pacifica]|nr:MAG: hypothetical protein M1812_003943 [Candelaria pacifica]